MIRHQQRMSLSELEANPQRHIGTSLIQMKDNYPTDMEDLYLMIGKKTVITSELEHCPLREPSKMNCKSTMTLQTSKQKRMMKQSKSDASTPT